MKNRTLSELESCVLAVIWRDGPITAYEVRSVFRKSSTANWRASTGSIYPLVRKLESLGYVGTQAVPGSKRKARLVTVTNAGKSKLKTWLAAPAEEIAGPVADPVRTRFYFLNLADKRSRKKLLKQWIAETETNINSELACLSDCEKNGKSLFADAQRGVLMQLEARKKWLADYLNSEFDEYCK